MRVRRLVVLPVLALLATTLSAAGCRADEPGRTAAPALQVGVVADGLDHPWEVAELPTGELLVTQRERRALTLVDPATGSHRDLGFPSASVWARGETGLLGLAVDPQFSANRRIYTCAGWRLAGGRHDIRVIAWTLDAGLTRATAVRTLLTGLPSNSIGRHGGCRLLVMRNGALVVGTGDAAKGRNPQSLRSLGGKVLRIDRMTGRAWPTNPWADRKGKRRYVLSYGHRNVQGLAQRADGTLWSVEHGSYRDDEINLIRKRGNYGWNPVPGYNEERPMTDQRLPGKQLAARWRSGDPTIAPSGAAFVRGAAWGRYDGALAVAVLKDQRLLFVRFNRKGVLRWTAAPTELRRFGRLRDVTAARDGSLLVTTDNGDGHDVLLRVRPTG
ncbi:PQQ-dependent sugar dehydrogenase [Pimelobacter simplex]|uniref:PQQ-dependent sugar dehydrogenase n=1 Tax=Nocardioides simplex TaxID=2045 RepID=UPI0005362746|nr:PQQ-dependent sugar dehydrogenase [Pimelobacter simplex]GEB17005.1 glucose dehydrogenase [Pimelobacter simplex]SFM76005.1 Glucose/arabinose dehydrogenase, beta-propeller fold [Pimelobacter simplex]